jgi:hypothetical protein
MLGQPDGFESEVLAPPPDHIRRLRALIDEGSDYDFHAAALLARILQRNEAGAIRGLAVEGDGVFTAQTQVADGKSRAQSLRYGAECALNYFIFFGNLERVRNQLEIERKLQIFAVDKVAMLQQ